MKRTILFASASLLASSMTWGLVNLGEGQLDLNLQVSSYYDTEIRARNDGQEDFIFSFRPSLVYKRPSQNLDFSASVGINALKYLDFDQYDDTDFFFDLNISPNAEIRTSRFRFSGDILLNTETAADDAAGEIITLNNYGASGQLVYDPNRNYSIIGSLAYRQRDPDTDIPFYYNTETTDASLAISIPRSRALNFNGGVQYRDTASDGPSANSETLTYFLGVDGELFSKMQGNVSVGLQNRSFELLEDTTSPYLSASLIWQMDDLSNLTFTGSQGLGTTIDDRSSENLLLDVTLTRKFSRETSGRFFVGYERNDYDSAIPSLVRDDKEYYIGAALNYQIARWGSVSFDARYSDQSSSNAFYTFDRLRLGVQLIGNW